MYSRKKLIILGIIISVSSLIIPILATGSIVTDTDVSTITVNAVDGVYSNSVSTKDLTVTGTCNGCGSGGSGSTEGNFSSYSTILINETLPFSTSFTPDDIRISNNGSALIDTSHDMIVLDPSGNVVVHGKSNVFGLGYQLGQSATGKYQIFINGNGTGSIIVLKNNSLLYTIFPDVSQFSGSNINSVVIGISPDGKYIGIVGKASGGTPYRVVIWQGS